MKIVQAFWPPGLPENLGDDLDGWYCSQNYCLRDREKEINGKRNGKKETDKRMREKDSDRKINRKAKEREKKGKTERERETESNH